MSDDDTAEYTDWLANSGQSYGYGYTEEQALTAMAGHARPLDDGETITVDLVEHTGGASTSWHGWEVETFHSGRRIEIPAHEFNVLRDVAVELAGAAEGALHAADDVQDLTRD